MSRDVNRAYWMLADTELPISRDKSLIGSFEAHFKHALLFNEKLMVSDAQAVNCVNLRSLIVDKPSFRELLGKDLFSVAVRDPNGDSVGQSLTEVRNAFKAEGKQHLSQQEFENNYDLDLIDEVSERVPYTYSALRSNYTSKVIEIFSNSTLKVLLGAENQKIILEQLLLEKERDNGLGRVFLHKNLQHRLVQIGKGEVWERCAEDIMKFSDAPYVTGIPSLLDTNPIYAPIHQESFQMLNPEVKSHIEQGVSKTITTELHLSSYEEALAKLEPEDILFLRDSIEFESYQKYIKLGINGTHQQDNALDALIAYQELIDQYIVKRHLGLKTGKQSRTKRFIQPLAKVAHEGGIFALGLALTDTYASGALTVANFFMNEVFNKQSHMSLAKFQREKTKLQIGVSQQGEAGRIKAERISTAKSNEIIYSSVARAL